jgi:peptidoglycan/xylan/chitin deacetylase (PgdA/CDA1 family)/GT2 family glycosyltransferase/SAM-dependent methyltransferase
MKVSVVIPARDAGATLAATLDSLRAQTLESWEALVVDDGSTDDTATVARERAAADARIRVLDGGGLGAGAARNAGIEAAEAGLLLFLDADDLLAPTHLERLAGVLADPGLGAVHCRWTRLAPDGATVETPSFGATGDLFRTLARACGFPIHACLVRAELVRTVGGFDPELAICEDWDLWHRVARTGARFGFVPEPLAVYRMRPDSASLSAARFLADGLRVLARSHGEDPRVPEPAPRHREGAPPSGLASARLLLASSVAGLALGAGDDARTLLEQVGTDRELGLDPVAVAEAIYWTAPLPGCRRPSDWPAIWREAEGRLRTFLDALEELSGAPDLAGRVGRALERRVVAHMADASGTATLGTFHARRVEAAQPLREIAAPPEASRLVCCVEVEGEPVGTVELPVCDGVVTGRALADAIAAEFAWPILGRYFARTVYRELRLEPQSWGVSVWRGERRLAESVDPDDAEALHDAVGWAVLLADLFDEPAGGETRRVAASTAVVDVSDPPAHLVTRRPALDVVATAGGAALGLVRVPVEDGVAGAAALRAAITTAAGFELARVAVREAIVGRPLAGGGSLRERLREAAAATPPELERLAALALGGGGLALPRRRPHEIGGAASRHGALPASVLEELIAAGELADGDVLLAGRGRAAYVPDLLVLPATEPLDGSGVLDAPAAPGDGDRPYTRRHFESLFAGRDDPWAYGNPYERRKYDQTLALVELGPSERVLELGCAEGHFTVELALRAGALLAADISEVALERARERCRDLVNVEFVQLDVASDPLPSSFDLIVCSETLYYVGGRAELEDVARKLAAALVPGGRLVTANAYALADDPDRTGFDWGHPFGARVIGETLAGAGGLRLLHELRTPLYRVQSFERPRAGQPPSEAVLEDVPYGSPLPEDVAAYVRWGGGVPGTIESRDAATRELPILMYHRVAAGGAPATARYRVSPESFEAQLRYLSESGFRSVTLGEWGRAMRARRPVPGRCVLITFDDGYRDFLTEAWPLLSGYGLGATLFAVAGEVGGRNRWDEGLGETLELLDWDELRGLRAEGLELGSHAWTHPRLTRLSAEDVVREAIRSRARLERELGGTVDAFAYPYGDLDPAVRRLVGACGYDYGLAAGGGRARLADDPLELPRLEISGEHTLADFVRLVDPDAG